MLGAAHSRLLVIKVISTSFPSTSTMATIRRRRRGYALRLLLTFKVTSSPAQDITRGLFEPLFADMVSHVVLGARDPEHPALGQFKEVGEVDVSLVKDRDLPGSQPRAERLSTR
jgi:hypothetical protein